ATAELDDVEAGDVPEHVQLGLVDTPDAPRDLVERPVRLGVLVRVFAVRFGPVGGVALCVATPKLRRAHRGTRSRSRALPTPASRSRARGCSASRAPDRRGCCPASRLPG